jgi:type IV pilus assembly protein PilO
MLQNRTSRWVAATAALCALLLVASWMLLIGPRRAEAADIAAQRLAQDDQNVTTRQRIAQLKVDFAQLDEHRAELAEIAQEMPADVSMPRLVRDLNTMSGQSGAILKELTPGIPTLVPSAKAATAGATAGAGNGGAATAGGDTAASGDAAAGTSASAAPAAAALYAVPLQATVEGDYFQVSLFLRKVQTEMARAMLVTGLTISPVDTGAVGADPDNGRVTVQISAQVFVFKTAASVAADAAAAGTETAPGAGTTGASTSTATTENS